MVQTLRPELACRLRCMQTAGADQFAVSVTGTVSLMVDSISQCLLM
jgi:hypothetical protein